MKMYQFHKRYKHISAIKRQYIPDKLRNATRRTDQLSGRSQMMGQFVLYMYGRKGISGTAALHIVCNQASKCVQENCP